jgi:SAM-dependent methyltransferase
MAAYRSGDTADAGRDLCSLPSYVERKVVPRLEDLQRRLESEGGAFLDVGVGIAALSISVARLWPSVRIVGIDIWRPSLDIAHGSVKRAGLLERIELREQAVEKLSDRGAFDLAWLPISFIPRSLIPAAVNQIRHALRPGGWLVFNTGNPNADPATSSFVRLRTLLWGGTPVTPEEAERLLTESGYNEVQRLPSPPSAPMAMIAARRV